MSIGASPRFGICIGAKGRRTHEAFGDCAGVGGPLRQRQEMFNLLWRSHSAFTELTESRCERDGPMAHRALLSYAVPDGYPS
jgi:hypothetical protein